MKEKKGITLVSLIITIVILLILAGVAIIIIQKNDITIYAEDAVKKYVLAQEEEEIEVIIDEWKTAKYFESGKTFNEFLDEKFGEDNVESNGNGSYTITLESGNKYVVTEDGNVTLKEDVVTDQSGTEGIQIGDKVAYNEGSGYTSSIDSSFVMKNMEWRVLDIEDDGTIELISTQPTDSKMKLGGEDGYLYGPDRLDTLCDDLYGNGAGAVSARSLKAEDIDKLGDPILVTTESWQYQYSAETECIQYRKSIDNGTTWSSWSNTIDAYGEPDSRFKVPGEAVIDKDNYLDEQGKQRTVDVEQRVSVMLNNITGTTYDGISVKNLLIKGLNNTNDAAAGNDILQWMSSRWVEGSDTGAKFLVRFVGDYYVSEIRSISNLWNLAFRWKPCI